MIISAKPNGTAKRKTVSKQQQIRLVNIGRNGLKYAFTQAERGRGE
jgi:hypothetical protein